MTETASTETAVTKVARDLTEIETLCALLNGQAVHKANDGLMPGGKAMVALGAVANLEAWENMVEGAEAWNSANPELPPIDLSHIEDEDDTWEPPLQTLCFWSEQWRRANDADWDHIPTIGTEANFIRYLLGWAWDNEPHWDDFVRDIRRARLRLEDVLHAGRRDERTRVTCTAADCERKPRLIKVYSDNPERDHHKCPACKHRYEAEDFRRAFAKQLRSDGAEKFVRLVDALATLKAQGRAERTIRKWFEECLVEGWCDAVTHEVWVWWPDLWRLHLTTATRNRSQGAA
jgi:hypothetical protein